MKTHLMRCPAHNDRNPSLSITEKDGKTLFFCHAGCSQEAVFAALKDKGLFEKSAPRNNYTVNRPFKNSAKALGIWSEGQPIARTMAESYLRSRCINLPLPPSLRFHGNCYHALTGKTFPAMIAAVQRWPENRSCAIHRTYLDGGKKADIPQVKMMLGSVSGGAVRLAPVLESLAVCEGIETGLSFMQETGLPTWCVLSASNYTSLIIPDAVKNITIAADHDRPGLNSAYAAADLWTRQSRIVRVVYPPTQGQDFNDFLKE